MKLYISAASSYSRKIRVMLIEKGIPHDVETVNLWEPNDLKKTNPGLKMYYYTSGNTQIRVAFTAAMMKLKGAKIPAQIVFPIQLQNQRVRDSCVKGYPQEASATSLIPLSLLKKMYP